ncbi:MAG: START domain-containing protein [Hahellaceae bacterium]|nr:START domain-containing protein [Hahellaceae bacterium]
MAIANMVMLTTLLLAESVMAAKDIPQDAKHWHLAKDDHGIQVYLSDVPGSNYEAFQGRATLNTSAAAILAVMQDPAACTAWVHQCREARALEQTTDNVSYHYGVNDFPWPADDRDYIIRITNAWDDAEKQLHIWLDAAPEKLPRTRFVRITEMQIHYILKPLSKEQTEIIWTQHTEPGGFIPSWMVNMLLVDIPFKSLDKLEATAQQEKYRHALFLYDNSGHIMGISNPSMNVTPAP